VIALARTAEDICNLALQNLGSSLSITDIDSTDDQQAVQCKRAYQHCLDLELEEHPWIFSTQFVELELIDDEEHPYFDFVYEYPTCLRVWRVVPEGADANTREKFEIYTIAGESTAEKAIGSSVANAWAEIAVTVDDPDLFTPSFVEALAWRMACRLCFAVTGSLKALPALESEYEKTRTRSRERDANEGVRTRAQGSKYKDARS
jgi:hypothetical protein